MIVYARHIRAAKLCTRGARAWFEKHNINWTEFLSKGVPANVLLATGDSLAKRVVDQAESEANRG